MTVEFSYPEQSLESERVSTISLLGSDISKPRNLLDLGNLKEQELTPNASFYAPSLPLFLLHHNHPLRLLKIPVFLLAPYSHDYCSIITLLS